MHGRTKYEELTTRNRHSAAEHKCTENVCTEETVYRTYCVHTEHVVTSCEFYSLGYYNRFYLYTLVPAEIGEVYMGESTGWEETGMSSLSNLGCYPYGLLRR